MGDKKPFGTIGAGSMRIGLVDMEKAAEEKKARMPVKLEFKPDAVPEAVRERIRQGVRKTPGD